MFKNRKKLVRHQYTIIELLVVLVIAGLLTGLTVAGIKGALARQGAAGAVRTLAAKISLAQSCAVSKNRYAALLIPDSNQLNTDVNGCTETSSGTNIPIPSTNTTGTTGLADYLFTQSRICYVTKVPKTSTSGYDYKFDSWVRGYEWQKLPSKTVAFIVSESGSSDDPKQDSNSAQVIDIPSIVTTSSAIIFNPSGALINAKNVIVRLYHASYLPLKSTSNFYWQGKKAPDKGWKIGINGFTGKTKFSLGGGNVFAE